ncbi:MAG: hypothetical protein R3B49_04485 [Phycisphaerales bacterium]
MHNLATSPLPELSDRRGRRVAVIRKGVAGLTPTGGVIHGRKGIHDAYEHGRGKVTVRGVCHTENPPPGESRW